MTQPDLRYLCSILGNLSGIPVRLYEEDALIFSYSMVHLPADPLQLCTDAVFAVKSHVDYYVTPSFHYYGIINADRYRIVVGPTRQIAESEQELRTLAFELDVSGEDTALFTEGMRNIVHIPYESMLQMLCAVNYAISGEKFELKDVSIREQEIDRLARRRETLREQEQTDGTPQQTPKHNTYDLEQLLLRIVRKGDVTALAEWMSSAPAVQGGVIATEQLRQRKNLFIVTATLVCRAAIQGGMTVDDAFSLSDSYIRQCELLRHPNQIWDLQYLMIRDYTQRVHRLGAGSAPTRLVLDVANFVQHHLSDSITVQQIAAALYISRPYLSKKFKEDSGENLTDFILKAKTEEAKRLLCYSDKSLTAIALYLGFSSPSHFTRVFRKYASVSPGEYRQKQRVT